jgi:hypothetical protein
MFEIETIAFGRKQYNSHMPRLEAQSGSGKTGFEKEQNPSE